MGNFISLPALRRTLLLKLDTMQYNPKLKNLAAQIHSLLCKNDVAGVVVLHLPGHSEYVIHISPSYSCASATDASVRIRAKIKEDFNGDENAWRKKVGETSNMFSLLAHTTGQLCSNLFAVSQALDDKVNAEHTDGGFTSETTQNN
jgi:hypothetical protein